jgi:predicted metal-dependent hydrolase
MPGRDDNTVGVEYKRGLALARQGRYFDAHEAFELAWRAAEPAERDFFQGLVHAVVFSYQAGRGRPVGAERQREKALRRLRPYGAAHRGLDLERLRAALDRAETDLAEQLVERDPEPPVAVEEEQQPEDDERHPGREPE